MPAPIVEFVDVNVNIAGGTAEKFSFGSLLGAFTHTVTANRQDGPFFSVAELNAAGFTTGVTPAINLWGSTVFGQDDGVDQLIVGRVDAADLNITESLDAIELADSDSWYITNIEDRDNASIALFGTWTEARKKIGIAQSKDKTLVAALALQAANLNRTALAFHDDDAEYLDGAWSSSGGGLNLDAPDGAGIWGFRELEVVPFDKVTGAEALAIYAANANLFGRLKGLNFTSKGTMASGRFIDVTTSVDWLVARLEEELLSTMVAAPTKIPYTNAGINIMVAAVQAVLTRGVNFGHLSTDVVPQVIAPDISQVSAADKQNRVLTLVVNVVLAGAIQKVVITLNVTF